MLTPVFVDEDRAVLPDSPAAPSPVSPPLGLHLGSVPLAGMQGLLLVGQAEAAEGAPEGRQGAGDTADPFSCFRVASGCSAIRIASRTRSGKSEGRPRPAAVGFGGQGVGVPTPLDQSGDERDTDAEPFGDLDAGNPLLRRSPRRPAPGGPSSKVSWSASTCSNVLASKTLCVPHYGISRFQHLRGQSSARPESVGSSAHLPRHPHRIRRKNSCVKKRNLRKPFASLVLTKSRPRSSGRQSGESIYHDVVARLLRIASRLIKSAPLGRGDGSDQEKHDQPRSEPDPAQENDRVVAATRQRAPTGQCEVNHSPSASLFKTEIAPDVAEPWGG